MGAKPPLPPLRAHTLPESIDLDFLDSVTLPVVLDSTRYWLLPPQSSLRS
ncbi:hypothetical protein [uncultured Helicobacter sp.]